MCLIQSLLISVKRRMVVETCHAASFRGLPESLLLRTLEKNRSNSPEIALSSSSCSCYSLCLSYLSKSYSRLLVGRELLVLMDPLLEYSAAGSRAASVCLLVLSRTRVSAYPGEWGLLSRRVLILSLLRSVASPQASWFLISWSSAREFVRALLIQAIQIIMLRNN